MMRRGACMVLSVLVCASPQCQLFILAALPGPRNLTQHRGPMLQKFRVSLADACPVAQDAQTQFTLEYDGRFFGDALFWMSFFRTLVITFAVAYFLARHVTRLNRLPFLPLLLVPVQAGNEVACTEDRDEAAQTVTAAKNFLNERKPLVRRHRAGGAEVQQAFSNQDIVPGCSRKGSAAALTSDGFPQGMPVAKESLCGSVHMQDVARDAPNPDKVFTLLNALLASRGTGASVTKVPGFVLSCKDATQCLTDAETRFTSFPSEQPANLQLFRAEAHEMKFGLVDPAVEAVKAA